MHGQAARRKKERILFRFFKRIGLKDHFDHLT